MLKRLELADQLPELLALPEVIEGHGRSTGGDADQLGGGACAADVKRSGERRPGAVDLADHRVGVESDTVEGEARGLRAVDQRRGFDLGCALGNCEEGEAVSLAG